MPRPCEPEPDYQQRMAETDDFWREAEFRPEIKAEDKPIQKFRHLILTEKMEYEWRDPV